MRRDRYQYRTIGQSQGESLLCTLLMAVITFTFIGLTTYLVTRPEERELNIIAPLYLYPTQWNATAGVNEIHPDWLKLEKSAIDNPDVQQVVVLNPGSSGDGSLWDPTQSVAPHTHYPLWKKVFDKLDVLKNVKLLGYVPTNYGDASKVALVKTYIDGYFLNWKVDGIFYDETGNPSGGDSKAVYKEYVDYTETKLKGAFDVFNFGSTVDQNSDEYDDEWLKLAELNIMYENEFSKLDTFEPSQPQKNLPHSRSALLMHALPKYSDISLEDAYNKQFGYVYFTTGSGANPWETLLTDYDKFVKDVQDFS